MAMDLAAGGCRPKNEVRVKKMEGIRFASNPEAFVIIKLPDFRALRALSRSLFLAFVILALPSIRSILKGSSSSGICDSGVDDSDLMSPKPMPSIFGDLAYKGFIKNGDKGLILTSGVGGDFIEEELEFLESNEIDLDLVVESDLDSQISIPNEAFDFVFTSGFRGNCFIDRILKIGGIVVSLLSDKPTNEFKHQQLNYKIVYLRRFESTVVAMRKGSLADDGMGSSDAAARKSPLCGFTPAEKKAALKGLEDVLLEPPRRALAKPTSYLEKIKFLPDLLGDSLESYQRRFFIADDGHDGALKWFHKNYPTKNQHFEVFNLEIGVYDALKPGSKMVPASGEVADWLIKNVKKEDYVVMKAEAQVVEELMKGRALCLVDELFLECKNQWHDEDGEGQMVYESKRAYWQCLSLYGMLRDEGVAVHQWWG